MSAVITNTSQGWMNINPMFFNIRPLISKQCQQKKYHNTIFKPIFCPVVLGSIQLEYSRTKSNPFANIQADAGFIVLGDGPGRTANMGTFHLSNMEIWWFSQQTHGELGNVFHWRWGETYGKKKHLGRRTSMTPMTGRYFPVLQPFNFVTF